LECYQKQVNKEFGTEFNMPVMYFTQLMGLAMGIPPKRLGIGSELVAVMPAIKEAQQAEPALAAD
jgi:heterodisulfide reductase subunit B